MIKKSFLLQQLVSVQAHDGIGKIRFARIFDRSSFVGRWDFVDYAIIPPGASIGNHTHENNEELYIELEGAGSMRTDNHEFRVRKGDMVLNPPMGRHGLRNDTQDNICILVIQIPLD